MAGLGNAAGGHGPADLPEIVGQEAQSNPALHARLAVVPAASQPEALRVTTQEPTQLVFRQRRLRGLAATAPITALATGTTSRSRPGGITRPSFTATGANALTLCPRALSIHPRNENASVARQRV